MAILEGKSPSERNKLIVAVVLGMLALFSLYMAFGPNLFGGSSRTTVTPTPTASPGRSAQRDLSAVKMPTTSEQNFDWQTTPIFYRPGSFSAPDPGRNIFAFYEPPQPTPWVPTPPPQTPIQTPIPTPTPHMLVAYVTPQSVYSGSRGFRLEINGDKFTPDAKIYFSQSEVPTTYINPQRLVADIPASFITTEGPRQIIVQTVDGTKYSNQIMLSVQAPPRPQFQYVGMIARRLANNDTAIFREQGKPTEFSHRLNDVIAGRFRLVSISSAEVIVEDTNLGFRHKLELFRPPPGSVTTSLPATGRPPSGGRPGGFEQGFPSGGLPPANVNPGSIPGIPDNIPRYIPPANAAPRPTRPPQDRPKDDDDDTDGKPR